MPVFGNSRMGADAATCIIDPYLPNVKFSLSGNGTPSARPSLDDTGTVALVYEHPDSNVIGFSGEWKYWPSYTTSMKAGLLKTGAGIGTALANLTNRLEYSLRLRCNLRYHGDNASRRIIDASDNHSGGWGGSGLSMIVSAVPSSSTTGYLQLGFACDDGSTAHAVTTPNMTIFGVPLELLVMRVTYAGGVGFGLYTQFYVNGTLIGESAAQPTIPQFPNQVTLWVADQNMYFNDLRYWNVPIASGSYTPAILPPC